ncbi:hypothetical protein [Agrococcus jejuensis]|uniref:hypothetical protein n=1 Tax=Agrococcus jejuensis TaxID=399736 RepID=UPI00119D1CA1|nr:hypothetical protein [Agrococcus jejuensis]
MFTRREAAIRLDIPVEMAQRHGIPATMRDAELSAIEADPPAWLAQSRANRRPGARPVWMRLECAVCGLEEWERPKKWWPDFTMLVCDRHDPSEAPRRAAGTVRSEIEGVGTRFVGIVDSPA